MARPISILICALGGEGGGVLASWLTSAAVDASLHVQRTSIPGVAQRTGATTYYLEIHPVPRQELEGREPVLGLYPAEGGIDMIVATELLEATRALHRGFASKERTVLIASTHRVYTITEKSTAARGRFNERTAIEAAAALTRARIQFDGQAAARVSRSQLNAVLLGAIAGSGFLPIPEESFRAAMRLEGKSVEENLRGFEAGVKTARSAKVSGEGLTSIAERQQPDPEWLGDAHASFPPAIWPILREGMLRLRDYQSDRYTEQYLQRLRPLLELDTGSYGALEAAARHLALWMSYEDVIRVAQLKTRPSRIDRLRATHAMQSRQPIVIVDYLKPGPAEYCGLLPPLLGRPLLSIISRHGLTQRLSWAMQVRTTSILGFSLMRGLALLRPWRPYSHGFQEQQHAIEAWLRRVIAAARTDLAFAAEIAQCAALVRGYGDTRERGLALLRRIFAAVIDPLLVTPSGMRAGEAVRRARLAAMADDTGAALESELTLLAQDASFHAGRKAASAA